MENKQTNSNKLGRGAIIVTVLQLIAGCIGTLLGILSLTQLTPTIGMVNLVAQISFIVSCILILCKKKIGVILYACAVIANITLGIITYTNNIGTIIGTFIFPILMILFVGKDRHILES